MPAEYLHCLPMSAKLRDNVPCKGLVVQGRSILRTTTSVILAGGRGKIKNFFRVEEGGEKLVFAS